MPGLLGAVAIVLVFLLSGLKVLREYERAVVFRLGRLVGARGPGLVYVIPGIEKAIRIDLRTITMDVPVAGRDHQGQRLAQGERGPLLPGDRREPRRDRGRELPLRHLAECADDAA